MPHSIVTHAHLELIKWNDVAISIFKEHARFITF